MEAGAGSRSGPERDVLAALQEKISSLESQLEQVNGRLDTLSRITDKSLTGVGILQDRIAKVNGKIEKFDNIVETFIQATTILGERLTRVEKANQERDGGLWAAINTLKAELNRTDAQVRTTITNRDKTINTLTKAVNLLNAPNDPS